MKLRERIHGATEYLMVILIILECRTVYMMAVDVNYHITEFAAAAVFAVLAAKLSVYKVRVSLAKRWGVFFFLYGAAMVALAAVSVPGGGFPLFFIKFLLILPALVLIFCIDAQEHRMLALFSRFSNVMTLYAVVSLFFWFAASQQKLIAAAGELCARWLTQNFYASYYGLYFECQTVSFLGYDGFRNIGLFCEPSMYSLCLAVALASELFLQRKMEGGPARPVVIRNGALLIKRKWDFRIPKIIILAVTIFTTFATTGLIVLVLIFFMKFVLTKPKSWLVRLFKALFLIALSAAVGFVVYQIFQIRIPQAALTIRLESYTAGLRIWRSAPFFGSGFAGDTPSSALLNSNSIFTVLAEGGLVLFSVYLAALAGGGLLSLIRRRWDIFVFSGVIVFELFGLVFQYTYLLLLLLAFFYAAFLEGKSAIIWRRDS